MPLRPVQPPGTPRPQRARLFGRASHDHHFERRLPFYRRVRQRPGPHRLAGRHRPGHPHEDAAQDPSLRGRGRQRRRHLPAGSGRGGDRAERHGRQSQAAPGRPAVGAAALSGRLSGAGLRLRSLAPADRRSGRDLLPQQHLLQRRAGTRRRKARRGVLDQRHRRVGLVHRRRVGPPP